MIKYIEKRDGSIAKFNPKNIYNAVYQSAKSCNEFVDVDNVVRLVTERLEKRNQPRNCSRRSRVCFDGFRLF